MAEAERATRLVRWPSGRWLGVTAGGLIVVALIGLGAAFAAERRLADRRSRLVDHIDPAIASALQLDAALVDQETGVRGYAATGRKAFLQPYAAGTLVELKAVGDLARAAGRHDLPGLLNDLTAATARSAAWSTRYAQPTVRAVDRGRGSANGAPPVDLGRALFDDVRRAVSRLSGNLGAQRAQARADLRSAARLLLFSIVLAGVLTLAAAVAAGVTLRRVVTVPLARVARDVRRVAAGDFDRRIRSQGPREIAVLSEDVDSMRRRILQELDTVTEAQQRLERQALELQRSNADLEQFAYVASHDLQEPLRKVAAFCQALERRYGGQLDERADQYIAYAVDGALRMQTLINDLLAFSRVGRAGLAAEEFDSRELVAAAQSNLASAIEESGAQIEVGELPTVHGDRSLLTLVFQNLLGNAIKFRREDEDAAQPHVRVHAERVDGAWQFGVDDDGIGIAPQYADRIFAIFQRLHPREDYPGTGIGLAMCRKIVEYHGGRIWLEPNGSSPGASFRFTLPARDSESPRPRRASASELA